MARERNGAHAEALASLRRWGLAYTFVRRPTTQEAEQGELPATGRPDIWFVIYGQAGFVEVKAADTAFPFQELTDKQRQWAVVWGMEDPAYPYGTYAPARASWWLWLCLGKGPVNARQNPRRTWLIDYHAWEALEARAQGDITRAGNPTASLPYTYMVEFGQRWELVWVPGAQGERGRWKIPNCHPFYKAYCQTAEPLTWAA